MSEGRKKKFYIKEAEEASGDEIEDTNIDYEALKEKKKKEISEYVEKKTTRFNKDLKTKSVEELAETLNQRHAYLNEDDEVQRAKTPDADTQDGLRYYGRKPAKIFEVGRSARSKVWAFKCRPKRQFRIAFELFYRSLGRRTMRSVYYTPNASNLIYIEASKREIAESMAKSVDKITDKRSIVIHPREVPQTLHVPKTIKELREGDWIRVKKGTYKGDLGRVAIPEIKGNKVWIQLVPRVPFLQPESQADEEIKDSGEKPVRAARKRPARVPFQANKVDLEQITKPGPYDSKTYTFCCNEYFRGIFVFREVSLQSIVYPKDVAPTVEEIEYLKRMMDLHRKELVAQGLIAEDEEDEINFMEEMDALLAKQRKSEIKPGDKVMIIKGELKSVKATVQQVESDRIIVTIDGDSDDLFSFPPDHLAKYHEEGDRIVIVSGKYKGESGIVVKVDGRRATVMLDRLRKKANVFVNEIEAGGKASGTSDRMKYSVHDLVDISGNSNPAALKKFGIITGVAGNYYEVLDNRGNELKLPPSSIRRKIHMRSDISGRDSEDVEVFVGDRVVITSGEYAGYTCTVKALYRSVCFVHSNQIIKNNGYTVTKTRRLLKQGGGYSSASRRIDMKRIAQAGRSRAAAGRSRMQRDISEYRGKIITIKKGVKKGYKGRVIGSSGEKLKVELLANNKIVTVNRDDVQEHGGESTLSSLMDTGIGGQGGASSFLPSAMNIGDPGMQPQTMGIFDAFGQSTGNLGAAIPTGREINTEMYSMPTMNVHTGIATSNWGGELDAMNTPNAISTMSGGMDRMYSNQGFMTELGATQTTTNQGFMTELGATQTTTNQGFMTDLGTTQSSVDTNVMPNFSATQTPMDTGLMTDLGSTQGSVDTNVMPNFSAMQMSMDTGLMTDLGSGGSINSDIALDTSIPDFGGDSRFGGSGYPEFGGSGFAQFGTTPKEDSGASSKDSPSLGPSMNSPLGIYSNPDVGTSSDSKMGDGYENETGSNRRGF